MQDFEATIETAAGPVQIAQHPVESVSEVLVDGKVVAIRPTPDQIDVKAQEYLAAKLSAALASAKFHDVEEELTQLVQQWGSIPPNAEMSRRLKGRVSELTVTRSNVITVLYERVVLLKEVLEANERGEFFKRLFAPQQKYELVNGAESALKAEPLPKRLAEKVMNLFGRCLDAKPKKPSLKVTVVDPEKPAKKPRAKKGAKQID